MSRLVTPRPKMHNNYFWLQRLGTESESINENSDGFLLTHSNSVWKFNKLAAFFISDAPFSRTLKCS